ncbi:MAG: hypothetical protein ACRD4K_01275 [Candidatus Acidiferrales bacterium]
MGAFTKDLTNPRLIHCHLGIASGCDVAVPNAIYPLSGPIPGDGAVGGKVPSFSQFFVVDVGLSQNSNNPLGKFCGWNSPLNGTTNPANAPVFHTSVTTTVPLKFQLGDGNSCGKKFISKADALLSIAQVLTPSNVSTFVPISPAQFNGHGADPTLFDSLNKQYIFNLNITTLAPGTYSIGVTFLTGNASPQTTYIKVVTP